ncbi:hypothetical protein [Microbulbifer halophilus]|uniref:Uncharacterized protein n=1 Tax=Microbulbifer halophilus TaxID=453963 RepID=A0ABW5EAE2_9GAMM|nr:hypothetical protein [Microbulbifer halophilus]MCW8128081.1 hypothetical protein [Microbulbifer halophilus]
MHRQLTDSLFEEPSLRVRLEEDLYLQVDKLVALVAVQTALDNGDYQPNPAIRNHYSLVIEEHALAIRELLRQLFSNS